MSNNKLKIEEQETTARKGPSKTGYVLLALAAFGLIAIVITLVLGAITLFSDESGDYNLPPESAELTRVPLQPVEEPAMSEQTLDDATIAYWVNNSISLRYYDNNGQEVLSTVWLEAGTVIHWDTIVDHSPIAGVCNDMLVFIDTSDVTLYAMDNNDIYRQILSDEAVEDEDYFVHQNMLAKNPAGNVPSPPADACQTYATPVAGN